VQVSHESSCKTAFRHAYGAFKKELVEQAQKFLEELCMSPTYDRGMGPDDHRSSSPAADIQVYICDS
jgi:IS30 family transposase